MKRYAFGLAVLALSALLGSVDRPAAQPAPVTLKTFSSGAGGGTHVRILREGNLTQFTSPGSDLVNGYGHLYADEILEGYVLCYTHPSSGATVIAHDLYFDLDEGRGVGFGPASGSCSSATACTVTRQTSNGILQLQQNFAFHGTDRHLRITMAVKNLTGGTVSNVILRRQVFLGLCHSR
jgi:hypothetical protein